MTPVLSREWKGWQFRFAAVLLLAIVWITTTFIFWVGYVGADDIFYARYAYLFHRPPMNWWEFRIPAILVMRASFLALGPSEFAAALPTLLTSTLAVVSVAWFVNWPLQQNWRTNAAVALASTLPLDVRLTHSSWHAHLASGILVFATVCILKSNTRGQLFGAASLATAFVTHENTCFYIAIFCATLLAFNWRRFWPAVAATVAITGILFIVECGTYEILLGDAIARFRMAAATTTNLKSGYDPDTGISGLRFFTWPLENLFFCKAFGSDLILLLITGAVAWRKLLTEQKILFAITILTWAWLGYGTQVPWAYKPFYRQMHYYGPLILGIAALLPVTVHYAFSGRILISNGLIVFAIFGHFLCLTAGGRWGEDVNVSRDLLAYATTHSSQVFVTDVATMNHMYAIGGFRLPGNVVCVNGPAVAANLRINKEPPSTPKYRFPETHIDGILINLEGLDLHDVEPEFKRLVVEHAGRRNEISPPQYKLLFTPFISWLSPHEFMKRSLGGEEAKYN